VTGVRTLPRFALELKCTRCPNVSLQVTGLVVSMRNQAVAALPFGFPVPLSCAELVVIELAADVVDVGLSNVVNDITVPNEVPSEFCAIAQKK